MDVVVPDLGDFADVEVIEVLVKPGDRVTREQGLITLETEKATMDVPSPADGEVRELKVKVGDRVSTGDAIAVLEGGSGAAPASSEPEDDGTVIQPRATAPASPRDDTVRQPRPAGVERVEPVRVPDLGDFGDVEIIDVLVRPGDEVAAEQGVVTLETEKASMDVPAPLPGTVVELKVKVGDRVSTGDELLTLRTASDAAASAAAAAPETASPQAAPASTAPPRQPADLPQQAPRPPSAAAPSAIAAVETSFSEAHASPSVRKLARELGVELGRVRGSGHKGRVTADDLKLFVKETLSRGATGATLPQVPKVDFAKFGPIEHEPLTRIQKISGPRLHASWVNIPHVTQHDEADITELEERRAALKDTAAARGVKLTPLAFVLRACALLLEEMPHFKASLDEERERLVVKRYTHLGFAADTPNGLVVPVIRDVDQKDVFEIARDLAALSERARAGKLKTDDIQGGVFSVSSLGGIGGRFFTPIINAPEVAILGVSRSQWQPVYEGGKFIPRLMLPLSLSYDHRVIDGASGVRFTVRLAALLGDVERLLGRAQ